MPTPAVGPNRVSPRLATGPGTVGTNAMKADVMSWLKCAQATPPLTYNRAWSTATPRRPVAVANQSSFVWQPDCAPIKTVLAVAARVQSPLPKMFDPLRSASTPNTTGPDCTL